MAGSDVSRSPSVAHLKRQSIVTINSLRARLFYLSWETSISSKVGVPKKNNSPLQFTTKDELTRSVS